MLRIYRQSLGIRPARIAMLWFLFCIAFSANAQQNNAYEVFAIKFAGTDQPFYEGEWADGAPKDVPVPISFMFWVLKGSNGKNVLVDAGFLPEKVKEEAFFKIAGYIRPDSALLKVGLKAGDITDMIISHPHWDHIGGLGLFPNAQVWMQRLDFQGFVGTAWQKDGNKGGLAKEDVRSVVELNLVGKLNLIDGDNKEILPGIKVFTGSKHTYDSQYVLVNNGKENVIIASDNIWIYYSLDHLAPPSPGGTHDPKGYVDAIRRMKTLVGDPKYILPGHDSRVFERFPSAVKGVAAIK
ncbi:N-acyl homoserine lactonase family protein [Dyadobacter sp. 22481]|uniref:N-acyl homoserine lactonase family protein n=1 Tax=Dyadobacter sp. 22481 TaxID=3453926 RepID=UPI003F860E86